jgi:hypothetical protein
MAYSFSATDIGIALLRQNVSTGEWFFVDWLGGPTDFVVDVPGAGTWKYEVRKVFGSATAPTNYDYVGAGTLLVSGFKR